MKFFKRILLLLLVVVLAAGLYAYIQYRRKNVELLEMDAAARKTVTGNFIALSDGITHYEIAGPDSGRVIVLVHGFSVPYYIWDSTFAGLVNAGYRALRYDAFGRGFSDRPDKEYNAELFRKQLAELLEKLNIQSVHAIAGLSFGGAVVGDFVVHYPGKVKKVILIDPVFPGLGKQDWPEFIAKYKMAISPDETADGQITDLKEPSRFPEWRNKYLPQMQYKGFRNALVSTRFHYGPVDLIRNNYRALDSLHKPALLVWGKYDITVPFTMHDSLQQILHTDFLGVDNAAHLPHMEKAEEVNRKLIEFLQKD